MNGQVKVYIYCPEYDLKYEKLHFKTLCVIDYHGRFQSY